MTVTLERILTVVALALIASSGTSDPALASDEAAERSPPTATFDATLPPPEHRCPTLAGRADGPAQDASPPVVREGAALAYSDVLHLAALLPQEVWRNRDAFFHEGMRMEIGPCHRRYAPAEGYRVATERHAGEARLDAEGNLLDYRAGLPFPPEAIDPAADDAALRWAWNYVHRYRGAGPRGSFRIVDFPSRVGGVLTYTGSWFQIALAHRADLASTQYRVRDATDVSWIAGGRFAAPGDARHLAWRQLRPESTTRDATRPDETFVYVPEMRKVRRAATGWVDGLFTPRYRAAARGGGGGIALPGAGGAVSPSGGASAAVTEHLPRGFTGLAIRPNAYAWRMLGVREVLAPINVVRVGYPQRPIRNYGPSGLSVGSDRWEVRQAVVIQGALRERGRGYDTLTLYLDSQTQQPLYFMKSRRPGNRLLEVGVLLHRYSGDVPGYPPFPDGSGANVFDPVAAIFVDTPEGGSGWRRESYDLDSTPPRPHELERMMSPSYLERGR